MIRKEGGAIDNLAAWSYRFWNFKVTVSTEKAFTCKARQQLKPQYGMFLKYTVTTLSNTATLSNTGAGRKPLAFNLGYSGTTNTVYLT